MTEEEKPKVKKESSQVKIVDISTQTAPAVQLEDGTIVSDLELLVMIYNDLQKIKRSVA